MRNQTDWLAYLFSERFFLQWILKSRPWKKFAAATKWEKILSSWSWEDDQLDFCFIRNWTKSFADDQILQLGKMEKNETNEKIRLIIQPNIFVWYSSLIPYHLFLFTFYQWKKRQFHPSFLRWHFASTHGTAIKIRLGTDTTSNLWIRVERGSTVQYCVCTTVLHAVHGKYQKQNVQCRLHAIHALSLQT